MISRHWRLYAALGTMLVVILIALRLSFGDALNYFYTPDEVLRQRATLKDKRVRVGGLVRQGSVRVRASAQELVFTVTDGKNAALNVIFVGRKPDLFRDNQGVVVEGVLDPGGELFRADRLLIKHSENYSGKNHDGSAADKKMLQDSLIDR